MIGPMIGLLLTVLLSAPPIKGVSIAPHYAGTRRPADMDRLVDSARAFGANSVQIIVQWGQLDVNSTEIAPYRWGTNDAEIRRMIRYAHARQLSVLLFPIDRLKAQGPGAWRGTLDPADRPGWWAAYRRFIVHYARLAADEQVAMLSIGSELGSMEADEQQWRALIDEVRARFPGRLTYSANWDHFFKVPFWDALDVVGVNAYFPITGRDDASQAELTEAWAGTRLALRLWLRGQGKTLVFTELGYPSVEGGARRPYYYGGGGALDLEEQRRAFAAVIDTWRGDDHLEGLFIWRWSMAEGPLDRGYTPKGKPAGALLRAWFAEPGVSVRPASIFR